jgi:hypothetical protein
MWYSASGISDDNDVDEDFDAKRITVSACPSVSLSPTVHVRSLTASIPATTSLDDCCENKVNII